MNMQELMTDFSEVVQHAISDSAIIGVISMLAEELQYSEERDAIMDAAEIIMLRIQKTEIAPS